MPEENNRPMPGHAYVVCEGAPKDIIGKILTYLDIVGLPTSQSKPLKDMMVQAVWGVFEKGVYIKPERYADILQTLRESRMRAEKDHVPVGAI